MELRGSRGQDIHCVCGGQARINSRCVTQDLISMDGLFFIPEGADIWVKVQYIQSAKFPADDLTSVCSIANRRKDESWFQVYVQWGWMEAQLWECLGSAGNSISLNYWFTAGRASRAASWLLRYHKTVQQPLKYFGALRRANWLCQKTISCFPYARQM